jgi:ACS family sodium-dependent inorganic phosphate cotransporter
MTFSHRRRLILLSFFAVFICYIDRVSISVAIIPMAESLNWDLHTQSLVMSAFFVGYLVMQIAGGRLADRFGGKIVLGLGVLLWSLFTFLTPPAAMIGLGILILARIGMGMGEAVTFPSIYSLYGRWVPDTERSRAVALTISAIPAGTVFALLVTPVIATSLGWPWIFYLFGAVGVFWWLAWHRTVAATPALQPGISEDELRIIAAGTASGTANEPLPLKLLLSNKSVWAIVIAHFCNNWSGYVLLSWMPTFINKGLGVDYASVGWLTMIPHLASFVSLNIAGGIADRMIRQGRDKTFVRKLMQSIGFGGISLALLVVGYVETVWLALTIMTLGSALSAFVAGGFLVNHMDIAPRHAGMLMGITNTAGTIPGIIGVYVSGAILAATGSWVLVFQLAAAVTLFGLICFLLMASGKKQFD